MNNNQENKQNDKPTITVTPETTPVSNNNLTVPKKQAMSEGM